MTEASIKKRLRLIYAALAGNIGMKPEDVEPQLQSDDAGMSFFQDFRGGRSVEKIEHEANAILGEIMGLYDRTINWLNANGQDATQVESFVRSEPAVALVHDLANTDKHEVLTRRTKSGHRPILGKVDCVACLIYDPSTGIYVTKGQFQGPASNSQTGEVVGRGTSSGLEVVFDAEITDEHGQKIGELKKLIPDAIYRWEQFLTSLGLTLVPST